MGPGEDSYRRYLDGDETAFDGVIAAYYDSLTFFLCRYVKDRSTAEDLTMDTLLELLIHPKRYHFKTKNARKNSVETDRIISATAYPDIQELIVAADVGITDYSSWICDLVLTQKPGFIYAPDLKAYDSERGFYYPLEETPFPIAETNEELAERIRNFDPALYEQKRQEFLKARGCKEDGHATEKIVEIIKGQCGLTQ